MQYTENSPPLNSPANALPCCPPSAVEAIFEADRQTFVTRGGANYTVAASLNWNLFNGFRDKSQIEEARQQLIAAKASRERMIQRFASKCAAPGKICKPPISVSP